ncbi:MAG TPA: ABC transporter permease [Ktedonobacteraceae bacterium]|jgi:ABC-type transport system involved in multi-copper enzyme maturation permease subunit|nr:ABC transporter permease [Ktedonobacteraceae bacterium]
MSSFRYDLRVIWACMRKDIQSALTERVFTILSVFVPVNVLILLSLFVLAGSAAPTAVVMNDTGPYAQQFYNAMAHARSFRLRIASASEAEQLITTGRIVAVVTIPADFDARVSHNQPVQVDVQINNLNTDFTNDIRRAVPLSITSFYAKAYPNLVTITPHEIDLQPQDTDYIPYLTVSILIVGLTLGGILQSGTSTAREYEHLTIKELLLSPASRWAIIVGKMLGAFVMSLASVVVVLFVLIVVIQVWPAHWGEVIGFSLLCLVIFIAFGTLLGTLLKQRQPVIALAFGTAIPLFFLSGAFGPISFSTPAIQVLAQIFPLYYAIVVQQHAFHNFVLNDYGLATNVLILVAYAVALILLTAFVLRRSNIAH